MVKKSWLVLTMAIGLMVGCSDPASEEVKGTDTAKEEKAEETVSPSANNDALAQYGEELSGVLMAFDESMNKFTKLNAEASQDPTLMLTDDWRQGIVMELVLMEQYIGMVEEIEVPSEMQESNDMLMDALDSYQTLIDTYPDAIDTLSPELMDKSVKAKLEGDRLVEKAGTQLNKELTAVGL